MEEDEVEHTFSLSILTPENTVFQDQVYSIIIPGADGYFEVLAYHAPIISLIQPGKLTITDKNHQKFVYAVTAGIIEVSQNKANLLIDALESLADIDLARAKTAYERAYNRIASQDKDIDLIRAKKALERAENRIEIFQEIHH